MWIFSAMFLRPLARSLSSASSEAIQSRLDARRTIHIKSMDAPSKAGEEVAASTTGRVSETPVPPAIARMFVDSCFEGVDGSKEEPYGPHRITGVVMLVSERVSFRAGASS